MQLPSAWAAGLVWQAGDKASGLCPPALRDLDDPIVCRGLQVTLRHYPEPMDFAFWRELAARGVAVGSVILSNEDFHSAQAGPTASRCADRSCGTTTPLARRERRGRSMTCAVRYDNEGMELALRRPPRGRGEPLLYLDFDGVLHPGGAISTKRGVVPMTAGVTLFQFAPLLVEDLAAFPKVCIVLSTSWQLWRGFNTARNRLPTALHPRVIGGTFHSRIHNKHQWQQTARGMQIWGDVIARQPKAWLALDDEFFGWPAWCRDRCVRTDEDVGLADPQVRERLRTLLADISA
jgi:hypothetical protein